MNTAFNIIEYMSGLTSFVLDESIFKRIAMDRDVLDVEYVTELTEKQKDLLTADILMAVYLGPNNIPSLQHQHGQFSTSIGSQTIKDREGILNWAKRLYAKWGDEKLDLIPESSLSWMM